MDLTQNILLLLLSIGYWLGLAVGPVSVVQGRGAEMPSEPFLPKRGETRALFIMITGERKKEVMYYSLEQIRLLPGPTCSAGGFHI